jgi:hypothetical protein
METGYQLFVDGRHAGSYGPILNFRAYSASSRAFAISPAASSGPRTFHIAIRAWHAPVWADYAPGGFFGSSYFGDSRLIASCPTASSKPPTRIVNSSDSSVPRPSAPNPTRAIAEAAKQFGQHDDISVLSITRTAVLAETAVMNMVHSPASLESEGCTRVLFAPPTRYSHCEIAAELVFIEVSPLPLKGCS